MLLLFFVAAARMQQADNSDGLVQFNTLTEPREEKSTFGYVGNFLIARKCNMTNYLPSRSLNEIPSSWERRPWSQQVQRCYSPGDEIETYLNFESLISPATRLRP